MPDLHRDQFGEQVGAFRGTYMNPHGSARVSPTGYVFNLGIKPESRGQGHGTNLMHQIMTDADRLGKPLALHARKELHPWYRRLGFSIANKHDPTFDLPKLERQPRRP